MRKNKEEIAKMRRAGRVVAEMHEKCIAAAKPGVTTADLDKVAREVLERRGARSNFLNYHGFPAVICTSPNDVIVHGIPGDYVLEDVTSESLQAAIAEIRDGNRLSDIGHAVQTVAESAGYSVVREYVGHGIGTAMHEEPQIPNYGPAGRGIKLRVGHVFAVEPMVNMGGPGTVLMDDGWTVKTADGSLSAHFEHTIAVTDDGPEVLTVPA